jgi:ABC-type transport system involved in cytochrome bd biosynthesis fused ATPase/permease subunit
MWLIILGILVVIGLFALAGSSSEANQLERDKYNANEIKEHTQRRVAAYADYIRRTSTRADVKSMSNNELYVLIEQASASYKTEMSQSTWVSNIVFVIAAFIAYSLWQEVNGEQAAMSIGMIFVLLGVYLRARGKKKVYEKYVKNGWEPERF